MIPFRDRNPSGTRPIVTVGIIVVNALVFLYTLHLGDGYENFVLRWGLVPGLATGGHSIPDFGLTDRAGPFLTSMFLHGGWLHLIGNMWYLWIFGDNIEDRLGHVGYFFFYVGCGIMGSLLHVATMPESLVPTIGASGAISGVLGAYLVCFPRARIATFVPVFFLPLVIELPALVVLGFWFVMQLFSGTASIAFQDGGGVAWWAHVGGFVAGMALIRLLPCRKRKHQSTYVVRFDRF